MGPPGGGFNSTPGTYLNSTLGFALNFPEFPGHPDFSTLGSPFSAFWGEMKLICWALLNHECS